MQNNRSEIGIKYPLFMKGKVYPPSDIPQVDSETPPYMLELEHIYGSSRKGAKGNLLMVNRYSNVLYPSAGCGVVYNPNTHTQKIFQKHNDDVTCLSLHPNKEIVATGEKGKKDMIYVWNSNTMELLSSIGTYKYFKGGGVIATSFSCDGNILAAVGGSTLDSILLIYDWKRGIVLAKTECSKKKTFALAFNSKKNNELVWVGKNEIKFFTFHSSNVAEKKAIVTSKGGKLQSFYSITFDEDGNTYVGTKDGSIYVFMGNMLKFKKKVHKSAVYSLYPTYNNDGFMSGSKDGTVKIFKFTKSKKFFEEEKSFNVGYAVSSVVPYKNDEKIFIWGKYNGTLSALDSSSGDVRELMMSHSGLSARSELWGLCTIPNSNLFFSAGDDGRIILWNKESRASVTSIKLGTHDWRGIDASPSGKEFTVASIKGAVFIFNTQEVAESSGRSPPEPIKSMRCGREEIRVVKYSECGTYLAIGSHNNKIYLYNAKKNYKKICSFQGHTSFITALDFSIDSKYMQSSSGDYELLYWDVQNEIMIKNPTEMRNVKWASQSCLLGWSIRGCWDIKGKQDDGTDINSIDVNFQRGIVACGDDFGRVCVYSYPTVTNNPGGKKYIGHSSHVTNVMFTSDGKHLLSAGGGDLTVFQWKVLRNMTSDGGMGVKLSKERMESMKDSTKLDDFVKEINRPREVHPLYKTSSSTYGAKKQSKVTKNDSYFGISGKFTKDFVGGMYRSYGLNLSSK